MCSFINGGREFERTRFNLEAGEEIAFHRHPSVDEWAILETGSITVRTRRGDKTYAANGTTVMIFMPANKLHSFTTRSKTSFTTLHEGKPSIEHGQPVRLAPLRVMIVDDNVDKMSEGSAMKKVLKEFGAQFEFYRKKQTAIERLKREPDKFDVVLLDDIFKGRLDGPSILDEIRLFDHSIPVLSIASTDEGHKALLAKKIAGQQMCQGFILRSDWSDPKRIPGVRKKLASCRSI